MTPGELRGLVGDLAELIRVYSGKLPEDAKDADSARVAVILGAQVLKGERPSPTLEARTLHAARLYSEGKVSLLVPTGGTGEHPPSEAEVMARILRREGVPTRNILLEEKALNTWESAWLTAEILRPTGVSEVWIVTDPLHCARAVWAFREVGLIAWAEPVYSSPMWRKRGSRRGQLAREMGAVVWYRVRHGAGLRSRR